VILLNCYGKPHWQYSGVDMGLANKKSNYINFEVIRETSYEHEKVNFTFGELNLKLHKIKSINPKSYPW